MFKKLVAPIIITAVTVLFLGGYVGLLAFIPELPLVCKIAVGAIELALIGVCIYVLVERIKEIRSGEENDLGKY